MPDEQNESASEKLLAAVDAAHNGLSVIPLCDEWGIPAKAPRWAHTNARHDFAKSVGEYGAAIAPESLVAEWWRTWPDANLGVITGRVSGVVVIDVDPDAIVARGGVPASVYAQLPPTPCVTVTGGGRGSTHHWYRYVDDLEPFYSGFRGRPQGLLGPGVDFPWSVTCAPSTHVDTGQPYAWRDGVRPWDQPLPDPPEWLVEAARAKARGPTESDLARSEADRWIVRMLRNPPKRGSRNNQIHRLASYLVGSAKIPLDVAKELTWPHVRAWGEDEPIERREFDAVFRSASRMALGDWPRVTWGGKVPKFPTEDLFAGCREVLSFVRHVSSAMQVPEDVAGLSVLAAASTAMLGRYLICPRDGWTEAPGLFTMVALDSGLMKSAVHKQIRVAMQGLAGAATSVDKRRLALRRAWVEQAKARANKIAQDAARKGPNMKSVAEAADLREAVSRLEPSLAPRIPILSSGTPEKFRQLIASQGALSLWVDEGMEMLRTMAGRYGSGAKLGVFIDGYNGSPIEHATISRGEEVSQRGYMALSMFIQPGVLRGILRGVDGKDTRMREQGMIARILCACPQVSYDLERLRPIDGGRFVDPFKALLSRIAAYPTTRADCVVEEDWPACVPAKIIPPSPPAMLRVAFSGGADEVLHLYQAKCRRRIAPGAELSECSDLGARLHGHAARVAGVLHCLLNAGAPSPVTQETASRAVRFVEDYALPHARHAYVLMGAWPAEALARRIWTKMRARGQVTRKEVLRELRIPQREADAALALLAGFDFGKLLGDYNPRGGRDVVRFVFNPNAELA